MPESTNNSFRNGSLMQNTAPVAPAVTTVKGIEETKMYQQKQALLDAESVLLDNIDYTDLSARMVVEWHRAFTKVVNFTEGASLEDLKVAREHMNRLITQIEARDAQTVGTEEHDERFPGVDR